MGYPGIDKSNPSGDGRAALGKVYHDLRRTSPEAARLLGISRKTVRRAREGPLEDLSRKPKSSPRRLRADFEQLILTEAKRTGYGPMRLSKLLWRKYTVGISHKSIGRPSRSPCKLFKRFNHGTGEEKGEG